MFKLEREHKLAIILGLLSAFLFTYFLQPILEWVARAAVSVMTVVGTAYLDRIYAQAAHLRTQDFSFLWLMMVFGFFSGLLFFAGLARLIGRERLQAFSQRIRKAQHSEPGPIYRAVTGALLIAMFLFFVVIASANYIQLRAISSFEHHMRALGPYLSEDDEEALYSQWSLMTTYKDYETVYTKLRTLATGHNLVLPENKLYTPTTL